MRLTIQPKLNATRGRRQVHDLANPHGVHVRRSETSQRPSRFSLCGLALLFVLMGLGSGACDGGRQELLQEQQRRAEAEQARQAAESAWMQADKAHDAAEKERSAWQLGATAAIVAAILLLILGIALGSSARRDARTPQQEASYGPDP